MTTLTLQIFPDLESARVLLDEDNVFSGNFHDFHQGCFGPVIAGYDLTATWDDSDNEPGELVKALTDALEAEGFTVKKVTETFESDDDEAIEELYFGDITREEFLKREEAKVIVA